MAPATNQRARRASKDCRTGGPAASCYSCSMVLGMYAQTDTVDWRKCLLVPALASVQQDTALFVEL